MTLFGGLERVTRLKSFFGTLHDILCLDSYSCPSIHALAHGPSRLARCAAALAKRGVMTVIVSFNYLDHIYVSASCGISELVTVL